MPSYNVGTLETNVKTSSEKAVAGIDALIGKIAQLSSALDATIAPLTQVASLSQQIKQIGRLNVNGLTKSLEKIGTIDASKLKSQVEGISDAIDPLTAKIKSSETALKAFVDSSKQLSTVEKQNEKVAKSANNVSKSFTKTIGKIYLAVNYGKRYAGILTNMIGKAIDFRETTNLWSVSMKSNINQATVFVNKLNEAYGISKQTVMNYQALFKNMLGAIDGLSNEMQYRLSESLVLMATDYASLFNTSTAKAMNAFQSMLSGQVRPIRSTSGFDTTEITLYEQYKKLYADKGLTAEKSMRQLNQVEKRLLRILAVQEQMIKSGAINTDQKLGDYAKTLEETANQYKILSEQSKEAAQWIGALFYNLIGQWVPYVNALVMTVKEVAKTAALMMGWSMPDWSVDDITSDVGDLDSALQSVQTRLFSFDKFDVLGGGVTASASSGGGIDQNILDSLNQYSSFIDFDKIEMKATQIRDSIMGWLGYTKEINEETGEVNFKLQEGVTRIDKIKSLLISILATVVVNKIITGIMAIVKAIKAAEMATVALNTASVTLRTAGIFMLIYAITTLITKWDDMDGATKAVYITIGLLGTALIILSNKTILKTTLSALKNLGKSLATTKTAMLGVKKANLGMNVAMAAIGITILGLGIMEFVNNLDKMSTTAKILIPVIALLAAVFTGLAVAKAAAAAGIGAPIMAGITAAAIAAGIVLAAGSAIAASNGLETGGFMEPATYYKVGENGKPELMGAVGGKSAVANVRSIESAMKDAAYEGMVNAILQTKGSDSMAVDININSGGGALARALLPYIKVENKKTGYKL